VDAKKPSQPLDDARRRFHVQGAQSYLDAFTAINEYQRQVQNKCREVLQRHVARYSAALGIVLSLESLKDYTSPDPDKWNGIWADLGTKIGTLNPPSGIAWLGAFGSLSWDHTDPEAPWFGVCVGLWLPKKASSALYQEMLRVEAQELSQMPEGVYLSRRIKEEEAPTFEDHLDAVFTKWIDSLAAIGGLNKIPS
jgi:hypothetical protein